MLSIAHGLTGALIASKIPNPILSIPLVLASHFLEDRVPHWDVGQGLSSQKKSKQTAFFQELFFDFPISILIVYLFFQMGRPFDWRPWLGWFIGLLPDFIEFPYLFLNHRGSMIKKFATFHTWCHRSTPDRFWGILPQVLILLLVLLLK
ncbi:hypothetical protein A3K29_04525 [Candidatus Collierbacteria bacterium RIFOXYB2_FULL_46_14]|uniref:Uncharacterized protein n=1 Tax=Candidatus Collierbacteria bacterium GW2011_GWA2_46_26 TaxID=1618381 RepID=A0A0G1PKA6_9BACT|nr:MAG: hypothetical protein UW29_C0005G0010 [Candidatus Collierbacteria bacterium GW2011_GWC2_44_13]KKU33156.1 MAG: hypothetical protein UX47_C0006G0127 [Candidatus Collierbacteria bacterium GW2011_GWA2_46_26]OGD73365.1 MAG: hypothetical protein A3K29_04525 [Candidatus Collierbacteria bacterium RIFOXYB2_FULL_46_14]OGD76407.1 MAG: hypothetical protein A3K43_04525 [Candidatus Collierbacteria bacterium RIFOXYA2_FULL_46_20]OGD77743.1 MAG: hypothetical protein A3K39_04525 [Candidatus Collierbacteri